MYFKEILMIMLRRLKKNKYDQSYLINPDNLIKKNKSIFGFSSLTLATITVSLFNSLKQGLRIFRAVKECVGKPMWAINLVFPDIIWLEITIINKNNYLNQGFEIWGIFLSIPLTISEFLSYIGKSQIYPFSLLFL